MNLDVMRHSYVQRVQYIWRIVRVGGGPAVVPQWQRTGGSSQGFDIQRLPAFSPLFLSHNLQIHL